MKKRKRNWILLASVLSILAVLDSGCGVLDTILRGIAGSCARSEFVVTRPDDPRGGLCSPTNCSLRQAVTLSNACPGTQTIRIPAGTYTLSIPGPNEESNVSGDLDITQDVNIVGEGFPAVDGNHLDRVFDIKAGATVSMQDLIIQNGLAQWAGGLQNYGNLTASGVLIQGNQDTIGGGAAGAWNGGVASFTHSAFFANDSYEEVAGIGNDGTLSLDNVTITGNGGYGVENRSPGTVEILFSTIADNNLGGHEAAYELWNNGSPDLFVISNSIVAGHTDEGNCFAPIHSNGFNIDSSSTTSGNICGLNQPSDLNGVDPLLLPAATLGGLPILPLADGSAALDSADFAKCDGTDQRGVPRPQGPACDRGAYEKDRTNESPTATASPTTTPLSGVVPAPQTTPTITPTVVPQAKPGAVSIESLSTDTVYVGGAKCGPTDVTITARATAPNPIQVVVLFYDFGSGAFQDVAMNPIGGDLFQRILNPTSLLGGSVPFNQSTLVYQVVVQQEGGDTSIRTPVMSDISLQACGSPPPPAACSSYSAQKACEAHGCNWDPGKKVCH